MVRLNRTIDDGTRKRLLRKGATIADEVVTAEPLLMRKIIGKTRTKLLTRRGLYQSAQAGEGGGGEPAPEWVPETAKIHIDLVNNRAWTEDDGEVEIDTLLGSDANAENYWGTTGGYDEANITAAGYLTTGNPPPAFIGSLRAKIIAGSTIVLTTVEVGTEPYGASLIVMAADGDAYVEIDSHTDGGVRAASNGDLFLELPAATFNLLVDGAENVLAMTLVPTRFDMSANGSEPLTSALTTDDFPVSGPSALVAIILENSWNKGATQSITVYDALPSTAGLSELSETGEGGGGETSGAPTISNLVIIDATTTTVSFNVDSSVEDVATTIYFIVTEESTPPTTNQIYNGLDANDDEADGSGGVTPDTSPITETGLTAGTVYWLHVAHSASTLAEDTLWSNILSETFTTDA